MMMCQGQHRYTHSPPGLHSCGVMCLFLDSKMGEEVAGVISWRRQLRTSILAFLPPLPLPPGPSILGGKGHGPRIRSQGEEGLLPA